MAQPSAGLAKHQQIKTIQLINRNTAHVHFRNKQLYCGHHAKWDRIRKKVGGGNALIGGIPTDETVPNDKQKKQ